ncbi:hypothetical protein [Rhizorhabdus sp.]|uniref:DUF7697 family protein n=1 Tax=Rhizorhabdus sp. TaxID=1968843 RepID=UPI0035B00FC0
MITGCRGQLRVAMGGAVGLDFGAILAMGGARGADVGLLAEILPSIEDLILSIVNDGNSGDDGDC